VLYPLAHATGIAHRIQAVPAAGISDAWYAYTVHYLSFVSHIMQTKARECDIPLTHRLVFYCIPLESSYVLTHPPTHPPTQPTNHQPTHSQHTHSHTHTHTHLLLLCFCAADYCVCVLLYCFTTGAATALPHVRIYIYILYIYYIFTYYISTIYIYMPSKDEDRSSKDKDHSMRP